MKLEKLFSREYSVQYTEVSIKALGKESKKHLPKIILSQTYLPEQKNEACYADKKEWDAFMKALRKKYPILKVPQLIKKFHQFGKKYESLSQKIHRKNVRKLKNLELVKLYQSYQKVLIEYSTFLWMGYLLNNEYSASAKETLLRKSHNHDKMDTAMDLLLSPSKLCGVLELDQDVEKIGKRKPTKEQLKKLTQKYCWLACLDIHNDPWKEKDILGYFAHHTFKREKANITFQQAVKQFKLDAKEIKFFQIIRDLTYVKDMRDVYRRKSVYYTLPLFDEISKRLGIHRSDLAYLLSEEIEQSLSGKINSLSKIQGRKKGFLIYWNKKKITVEHEEKDIREFIKKYVVQEAKSEEKVILKGMCASKGQAKGKVKIVLGIKDLSKVKKGDIMVAITTHPDFVPAMKRASAIITDEGGITSHAAIVSREMGVPCIVGTKNATKLLRDNDMLTVNATKGCAELVK